MAVHHMEGTAGLLTMARTSRVHTGKKLEAHYAIVPHHVYEEEGTDEGIMHDKTSKTFFSM